MNLFYFACFDTIKSIFLCHYYCVMDVTRRLFACLPDGLGCHSSREIFYLM